MFRKGRPKYELPENVVSFLRGYNQMYILDSNTEARNKFEEMVKEMIEGRLEDYVCPIKRIDSCSADRGILIQLFCKGHTFGIFSYYWEDRMFFGKFRKRNFITMHVNSNQLMKIWVSKNVVIEGKTLELSRDMEVFQELFFAF